MLESLLIAGVLLCLGRGVCGQGATALLLGETYTLTLQPGAPQTFVYKLSPPPPVIQQAVRLMVHSDDAQMGHPVLVTVRQSRGVASWALPYVESGFSYPSVERTLCPLLNAGATTADIMVDISSSSPTNLTLTLRASLVHGYSLKVNQPVTLSASPSGPAYYVFEYPPEHTRVRVKFTSDGETGNVCAIASIQKTYCPVVELLDNPDHRGTFQTMQSIAAITTRLDRSSNTSSQQRNVFDFFYVVVTVFPSNDECVTAQLGFADSLVTLDSVDNYNPTPYNSTGREKNVTIIIEPALPDSGYILGTVVPVVVYMSFYIIALVWIIVFDWWRYKSHPLSKRLDETSADPEVGNGLSQSGDSLSQSGDSYGDLSNQSGNPEYSTDEPDGPASLKKGQRDIPLKKLEQPAARYQTSLRQSSVRQASVQHMTSSIQRQRSLQTSIQHQRSLQMSVRHQTSVQRQTSVQQRGSPLAKRPSLWRVLTGSHWKVAFDQAPSTTSPSCSPRQSPSLPRRRHDRVTQMSLDVPPGLDVTQSLDITRMRRTHPSHPPRARLRHSHSVEEKVERRVRRTLTDGLGAEGTDCPDSGSPEEGSLPGVTVVELERGGGGLVQPSTDKLRTATGLADPAAARPSLHKSSSYDQAVLEEPWGLSEVKEEEEGLGEEEEEEEAETAEEEGRWGGEEEGGVEAEWEEEEYEFKHDSKPFPVNLLMSELQIDDSPAAQKEYNRYAWYLLAVVIFYGIPAFQLVLTYQQLLSVSGNQDICYYNSLCSHPWYINSSHTIIAFNNIFSNIGYFVLGVLVILLAYRRRVIYRDLNERFNNPLETFNDERYGIPQHFGIYYAIGLTLMAEAFMSAAYHICPSSSNYQFDTTYMFVLAGLGLYKMIESRSPDVVPRVHKMLLLLAVIILLVVVGVLYSYSVIFYSLYFIMHILLTLVTSVLLYYRWQIRRPHHVKQWFLMIRSNPCPPKQIPKFVMVVLSNLVNLGFAIYAIVVRPLDFGSYFLSVMITNFTLALFYYVITKVIYREIPSIRPVVYFFLSVVFWICGVVFYTRAITNWLKSPAVSRNGNEECIVLGFFDAHDIWHFVSAFALFFSFLMLMTLDDRQEGQIRTELRAF